MAVIKMLLGLAACSSIFLNGAVANPNPEFPELTGNLPMQKHVAYAGPTGMMVSWNTYSKLDKPTVYYGTTKHGLTNTATSDTSFTYKTSTTYNNHVKITGLKPNTMYYYRVINGKETKTFTTSRAAGDHTPFEVALVVDLGTMGELGLSDTTGSAGGSDPLAPGETNTIQALNSSMSQFDFVWHPGDIAYADYWLKEEIQKYLPNTTVKNGYKVYERILNKFYDEMAAITSYKPYMVGPGNHEANCDNGGTTDSATNTTYTVSICMEGQRNFTGYRNHFRMPSSESGGLENFWYSFDHGMTHFVQLNTETDLGHGFVAPDEPGGSASEDAGPFDQMKNAQTKWLREDLAAVDRKKTPWIVAAGHRPWYISSPGDACESCKDVFEPILNEYGVDLVVSGHVHAYQRNDPIKGNKADPNGLNNPSSPWYITNGAAGHYDGLDTLTYPLEHYAVFAQDTAYGWSRLLFHNCTHMTHEFVASGNGSVLDTATLYKQRTC